MRFKVVIPRASILPPLAVVHPARQGMHPGATGWIGRFVNTAVMEKSSMFMGLPGIELSNCGTALLLYATFGLDADSPSAAPLSVVGALALAFGVTFITTCAVIAVVRHSMGANGNRRVISKD